MAARYGVFVGAGVAGGAVGRGVVGAAVGGGVVAAGGAVVAGGALVGASVGAGVAVVGRIVMLGSADIDAGALALGDADPDVTGAMPLRPRKSTPITSTVSSAPATAARARSIQRGPRRGGGRILVVSFEGRSAIEPSSGTRRAARRPIER